MTDSDDKLSRRYRELPRDEPSAQLDASILAASRRALENRGQTPDENRRDRSRVTGVRPQWMVPTSIAAVLVLGIGVSLRMQLEQPGVETSAPTSSSSAEYPMPPSPAPEPPAQPQAELSSRASAPAAAKPDAAEARKDVGAAKRRDATTEEQARATGPA